MRNNSERNKRYRRTKNGFVNNIYRNQKKSSKNRGHTPPEYSLEQLKEWCFTQDIFIKLFDNWVYSGYDKNEAPSIDRIDDYKGYSFDNIQLMTWKENLVKSFTEKKQGINNKCNKKITEYDCNRILLKEYHSISYASRCLGISKATIFRACASGKIVNSSSYFSG